MNLLFIHDSRFFKDEGLNVFTGDSFTTELWENNYLTKFDKITVIGRRGYNISDRKNLSSGNDRVSFNLIEAYSSLSNLFKNFSKIYATLKYEIERHDTVIIRLPSILGFLAGNYLSKKKRPFLVEQVGNSYEAFSMVSVLGKISAPFFHAINKKIVIKAPFVIYVTKHKLQESYQTRGINTDVSNVVIHKVFDVSEIDKNRFFNEKIKIALIGTFTTRYKGQETLLKAISILPEPVRDNIELYLVGKGDYEWIEKAAKELGVYGNIKFVGAKKPGDEIFGLLKEMSLYTQPSFTEGLPRAMLEAMSVGCPVLASNVGGIPDVLDKEQLHKPGDYKTLSSQIMRLYSERNLLFNYCKDSLLKASPYLHETLQRKRGWIFDEFIEHSRIRNIKE